MKIAICFVLAALLGIASCDIICMQIKLSNCFAAVAMRHFGNPVCGSNKELTDCLRDGARECGVESAPVVGEVIATYTESCKEGSAMGDLYKKHRSCVFQDAALGNGECLRPLFREIFALGYPSQTREYQERVLKVACRLSDVANKCIEDNINKTCGTDAAKFRRDLSDASIRLSNQACNEMDAETNEIHYSLQQHDEHSVHVMAPNTQHLSAAGSQAGSIHIASTLAPAYDEPKSGAIISSVSSQLVYVLIASVFMKWFSLY